MSEPDHSDPDIIVRRDDFPAWMGAAVLFIVAGLMVLLWMLP
jgi:hypothetical protein